jgi:hypothetical protein
MATDPQPLPQFVACNIQELGPERLLLAITLAILPDLSSPAQQAGIAIAMTHDQAIALANSVLRETGKSNTPPEVRH